METKKSQDNNFKCKLSVLYLNNHKGSKNEIEDTLNSFYIDITVAKKSQNALHKYIKRKMYTKRYFDIVVTDLSLLETTDFEIIHKIKLINPEQVFIFISENNFTNNFSNLTQFRHGKTFTNEKTNE